MVSTFMLTKSKMGRPKLPRGKAKGVLFAVRVDKSQAVEIDQAIAASGQSKPDWTRNALLKCARSGSV